MRRYTEYMDSSNSIPLACSSAHPGIEVAGEQLILLPERAVLWPTARTLFIADTHFGKAHTFRAAGIPAPERSHHADLDLLASVIDSHQPERLIILGDLLHSRTGVRPAVIASLETWRRRYISLDIQLVRGNHDRSAGDPPDLLNIRCVDPGFLIGPFTLHHEPPERPNPGSYALCGHIHPGIRLATGLGQFGPPAARFPAFIFGACAAVLPAFGSFTGLAMVKPLTDDRVAIIADGGVLPLWGLAKPKPRA